MMQRRQREAEHRLKTKKYRRRGSTNLAHLYERCSQSKLMSMVANPLGAIGCIREQAHHVDDARMPLTLTFLGYGFVILYFVVANRLRPGRRPRAQVDVESGEAEPGPSAAAGRHAVLTATAPSSRTRASASNCDRGAARSTRLAGRASRAARDSGADRRAPRRSDAGSFGGSPAVLTHFFRA
ncbi:hypothetical protein JL720_14584 [Aureococcus anophagefferens]|nr:hypothetical protein JL720_14584 [Aureococcus anophagefferens]